MPRIADVMLTTEEVRLRKRKRRQVVVGLIATIALVAVATLAARPVRDAIKGWQSRRHAEKAFALIEQSNWKEARDDAVAAFQLRPEEPQALRAVARLLARTRQPDALDFWHRLEEKAPLTRTDRRDQAAVALALGENDAAATAVHALFDNPGADPPTPGDWVLAAQLAIQENSIANAQAAVDKVLENPRSSEREQFQAVLLQFAILAREDPDQRAAHQEIAVTRLRKLADGQSSTSLEALTVIVRQALSRANGSAEPALMSTPALVQALQQHPLAKAQHKLLALDLQIHDDASVRESLINRGIAEWKDADPADVAVLAEWLNGKGEFQRQLDAIPLDRALQNRDLFLQHLDALGALGQWEEIKHLLQGERFPLDQVVASMYLARCNAQLGEKKASENNWKRALETARGDISKVISLASYAEKNGAVDVAEAAYQEASLQSPKLRAAQQGRLRIAQMRRDTAQMHAVLAEMLKLWPNDTAVQNDEAYTRLLLLRQAAREPQVQSSDTLAEAASIEQTAVSLVEREPASLPHRTLLALARLRQHKGAEALAVYEKLQITPQALTPSALAVHAAVLAANGNADGARTEADQVAAETLLPEEHALIADLL